MFQFVPQSSFVSFIEVCVTSSMLAVGAAA
jgi:hypothetical protein